jgi:hypothetical protein
MLHHDVAAVAVLNLAGQQQRANLGGVVRLQVRGLVSDLGVRSRVRVVDDQPVGDEVVIDVHREVISLLNAPRLDGDDPVPRTRRM